MNAPTKETLRAEAAEAIELVNDFAVQTKEGDSGAAQKTAEKISGMVQRRPILSGKATDQASYLIETLDGNLGNGTKVGLANLMLRLNREAMEAIRGRLAEDKKPLMVRKLERAEAAQLLRATR